LWRDDDSDDDDDDDEEDDSLLPPARGATTEHAHGAQHSDGLHPLTADPH
jgi:hypothetical protein